MNGGGAPPGLPWARAPPHAVIAYANSACVVRDRLIVRQILPPLAGSPRPLEDVGAAARAEATHAAEAAAGLGANAATAAAAEAAGGGLKGAARGAGVRSGLEAATAGGLSAGGARPTAAGEAAAAEACPARSARAAAAETAEAAARHARRQGRLVDADQLPAVVAEDVQALGQPVLGFLVGELLDGRARQRLVFPARAVAAAVGLLLSGAAAFADARLGLGIGRAA